MSGSLWLNLVPAFVVGGLLCVCAQLLMDLTKPKFTPAHVLIVFASLGTVTGALGWYEPLVKFAGAGATVPLTGFGYVMGKGAVQGAESGILGVLAGGIEGAAIGITAAILFSFICAVSFKPKG
ncbi:MAG: SpoVA/SpoVAEb family sporulation membrane protein [Peptococcaceae bacterium]|nr:SpoVA/SpoVAEb family sporulation membrane protein [Peptococcaceae bacterium]